MAKPDITTVGPSAFLNPEWLQRPYPLLVPSHPATPGVVQQDTTNTDIINALSALASFNTNFPMEKVSDVFTPSQGMSLADIKSIAAQLSPNMEFAPLTTKDLLGVEDVGTLAGLTPEQVLAGAAARSGQLTMKAALDKSALDLLRENTGARLAEQLAGQAAAEQAQTERTIYQEKMAAQEGAKGRNVQKEIASKNLNALLAGIKGDKGEKKESSLSKTKKIADIIDILDIQMETLAMQAKSDPGNIAGIEKQIRAIAKKKASLLNEMNNLGVD